MHKPISRIRRVVAAVATGLLLASATVASSAQPAQADAPQPHGHHLTWADCYAKGNAGLNIMYVDYYCTTDYYDTKIITLMVYYPE
ncbi:hypothetical protein [Phytohabitans rumicis]|uniref:hypothetical protein n=1 Tax=Phytohabitans rumicis TaxID=1076125 RepID=UPI0031E5DEBC